jgi:hypothetical protein
MSNSGRKSPRLVADKRYRKPAKPASKPRAKSTAKPRKASRRTSGGGGGPLGFVRRLIGWILRLFWWVTWRVTAVVVLVTLLAVGYVYMTLPDVRQLLDGRAPGRRRGLRNRTRLAALLCMGGAMACC